MSISTSTSTSAVSGKTRADIKGLFEEARKMYAPGGGYASGVEAGLKRGRVKAVASGMQGLAAAGLGGTSMMGGLGLKYEEDVAAPTRAKMETQRLSALSSLLSQQAGVEAQLAPRTSTQRTSAPSPYLQRPGQSSSVRSAASKAPWTPLRSNWSKSSQKSSTTPKRPTFRAFPSLPGIRKQPSGYKGVYFGKASYGKQKKSSGSFYSNYLSKGGTSTGLKGFNTTYGLYSSI